VFALYITAVVLDEIFGLPVTRATLFLVAVFMALILPTVHQSSFKNLFFFLSRKPKNSAEKSLSDEELRQTVDEIIRACQTMSKSRTGALIVIATDEPPTHILETGVALGAFVSAALLESIFNTKAPFHDGASIVKGNKILAAGCFLPLSQSPAIAKNLGTRHRAGVGITEETDMLTIIVSEETGIISVAEKGALRRFVTSDRLRDMLYELYAISPAKRLRSI
jgi:diadenylate cyclase